MSKTKLNKEASGSKKLIAKIRLNVSGWTLLIPTIILFIFIVWRPIVIGITYSFFSLRGFTPEAFVGLENYRDVLSDTNFTGVLWNTVQYVLWSLVIGLPLPFLAAVAMNEMLHAQQFFKITTYLPCVLPGMAVYLLWTFLYGEGNTGVFNSIICSLGFEPVRFLSNSNMVIFWLIVMMTWKGFGGTTIMYLATLQGVDKSLYEAARIDGANFFQRFKAVTWPPCRGIILLLGVRQIISVFGVTEQPMVMTGGGPDGASMSIGLQNYYYAFKFNAINKSLALGVTTFLLLMGLTIVYFILDKKINE